MSKLVSRQCCSASGNADCATWVIPPQKLELLGEYHVYLKVARWRDLQKFSEALQQQQGGNGPTGFVVLYAQYQSIVA